MSAKIITFPSSQYSVCTPSPPKVHANPARSGAEDHPNRTKNAGPRKDRSRKDDAKSRNVEPNIREFSGVDGRVSYRVQIRKTSSKDKVNLTKTFSNLAMARKWKKKKLAEIEIEGVKAFSRGDDTVSDAISARLAKHTRLGRSAVQQLTWLKTYVLGTQRLSDLTMASLYDLADDMLSQERQPQTVAGYLTILVNTLDWASRRDFNVPVPVLRDAMKNMWEDEVFARSEERSRRPEKDELDRILAAVVANKRQKIPLTKIIVFALFSCRRIAEICRLRWDDLKVMEKKILVRDMKHPRKKKGNDVWCDLTEEAIAITLSMPREGEFIFPFKPESVGAAWRRHRDRVGIVDLRFHDLRHEGITRLFEMGKTAPFVAKHSGHKSGGCLYRYEHVAEEGDKWSGWSWIKWASKPEPSPA